MPRVQCYTFIQTSLQSVHTYGYALKQRSLPAPGVNSRKTVGAISSEEV